MQQDMDLAMALADIADSISMQHFRSRMLSVHTKADLTPVTAADCEIESAIRARLRRERPEHGVLGEEFGADPAAGPWRWVIDPIDGTKSYSRGNETWATLIALQHDRQTVVAVASVPAFGHRYRAMRGGGAFLNGDRIHASAITDISDVMLTHTGLPGFARTGLVSRLADLAERCWDARGVGNSLTHLSVARGSADIGWTSRANVWDFAALALIVDEAGGRFTDRSSDDPLMGGPGVSSNAALHDTALAAAGLDA